MVKIDSEPNGQAFNKLYATGAAHVLFILNVGGLLKGCWEQCSFDFISCVCVL